ncbi:hypothetical protein SLA2020_281420 [Shorea laevis]
MSSNQEYTMSTTMEAEVPAVILPGFRFHPTDEELVGFYLRRKVEKKPITFEVIKQIDIYKYDPWDLPKGSSSSGVKESEWYFFCKRGRKYRNSIRPNRVTGSGFWKATGIDKQVYSMRDQEGHDHECIGLKKTLVYYRGSAGKGIKTDWMMHEFRLPASNLANTAQEAEIWTLCRIFKRNIVSHRKYKADWRELSAKQHPSSSSDNINHEKHHEEEIKPVVNDRIDERRQLSSSWIAHHEPPSSSSNIPIISTPGAADANDDELFAYGNWDDELRSVVDFALHPSRI